MALYPHDSCHFLSHVHIQNDAVIFKCVVLLEYVPVFFNLIPGLLQITIVLFITIRKFTFFRRSECYRFRVSQLALLALWSCYLYYGTFTSWRKGLEIRRGLSPMIVYHSRICGFWGHTRVR